MRTRVPARRVTIALALAASSLVMQPADGVALHRQVTAAPAVAAPRIPESLRIEHEAIHRELVFATREKGQVGAAARALARILDPHFEREEQIALPPLGLVAPLARGEAPDGMRTVLPITDSLRAELPQMLAEHARIRAATKQLERVARGAGNIRVARLGRELALHAQTEEELLYPMAVLVGDLVRMRTSTATDR